MIWSFRKVPLEVGVLCLLAGAVFGLVSVYSNSRGLCAVWVVMALAATFISGLLLRPAAARTTRAR